MASSSRTALLSAVLALRLLTLALLAASLAVIAADKFAVDDDHKFTFKDVYAYRYVLAVAVVGCVYTLIQIPFAAVGIARRKGMIGGSEDVALFLVCADVVCINLYTYVGVHVAGGDGGGGRPGLHLRHEALARRLESARGAGQVPQPGLRLRRAHAARRRRHGARRNALRLLARPVIDRFRDFS
uniref:CASP-like protein n=1 Tax=Oryza brachyantha TaxID=4533 RepID=J3N8Y9_ORYBR